MLDFIAEQKIAEAVAKGELDDLPGAGQPLDLSDDALIPEELRLAYRILKNAGFVPPEIQTLNEIAQLDKLCFFSCAEYTELKKAIAEYEKK